MFYFVVYLLLTAVLSDIDPAVGWNLTNFSFNPDDNYQLVWQDQSESVDPVQAIINGKTTWHSI